MPLGMEFRVSETKKKPWLEEQVCLRYLRFTFRCHPTD